MGVAGGGQMKMNEMDEQKKDNDGEGRRLRVFFKFNGNIPSV
jgi:hypothetical protein